MTLKATARARVVAALAGGLALAGSGCDDPVNLGPDPDFTWWSDHETGDLADWKRGGAAEGASYEVGGGTVVVQATDHARSGSFALVSTAADGATTTAGQASRKLGAAPEGYFGAWFYVPAFARPATYWVFFSFHDGGNAVLWDLKLAPNAAGDLTVQLLGHATGDVAPLRLTTVPLGRWFQVQAYYRARGDAGDLLRVWQDDDLLFEIAGADAAGATGVQWTLGTITDGLTPAPAALLVDDAFIAKRRIAANAASFWRAP